MEQPDTISYQACLRAIGAHVDERLGTDLTIIEAARSFVVTYDPAGDEMAVEELTKPDLIVSAPSRRRRRRRSGGGLSADLAVVRPGMPYEDRLRALGFELDALEACSIVVHEVEGRLLLTYQYLNEQEGYLLRKRLVVVGDEDGRLLVEAARNRRQKRGLFGRLAC